MRHKKKLSDYLWDSRCRVISRVLVGPVSFTKWSRVNSCKVTPAARCRPNVNAFRRQYTKTRNFIELYRPFFYWTDGIRNPLENTCLRSRGYADRRSYALKQNMAYLCFLSRVHLSFGACHVCDLYFSVYICRVCAPVVFPHSQPFSPCGNATHFTSGLARA